MTRRTYPWAEIVAHAVRHGVWVSPVELKDAPARTVHRIRARNHPDLRYADGRLEARITNIYTDELGTERGDIWVRHVPHTRVNSPHTGANQGEHR